MAVATPAWAQDDEDLFDDDEKELDEIDDDETLGDEDILDIEETPDAEGLDDANVYRAQQDEVLELEPDEEIMAWEDYLGEYPNSTFKDRINKRIDELTDELYGTGGRPPGDGDGGAPKNADRDAIDMSQGLLLENIEPRDRIQAGFEWGLPDYANFILDYEKQLMDELSLHGGVRRRYTGWSIETGVKYALVRSVRTQTLVTFIGDIHVNASPAFVGIRPQVAFGKRFGDKLDLQAQLGPDFAPRTIVVGTTQTKTALDFRIVGGLNVTYRAADSVSIFAETAIHMKNTSWPDYRFNVVSFGLKFYPQPTDSDGLMEVNLGASAPAAPNYWMYHYGSIMGQVNYYMD